MVKDVVAVPMQSVTIRTGDSNLSPEEIEEKKKIADAKTSTEVLSCISADSREAVDEMIGKARAAGGVADPSPKQDYGFMYGRSFEDPDGHIWEVMWMDVAAATAAQSALAHA